MFIIINESIISINNLKFALKKLKLCNYYTTHLDFN